jgi:hypothetical protein
MKVEATDLKLQPVSVEVRRRYAQFRTLWRLVLTLGADDIEFPEKQVMEYRHSAATITFRQNGLGEFLTALINTSGPVLAALKDFLGFSELVPGKIKPESAGGEEQPKITEVSVLSAVKRREHYDYTIRVEVTIPGEDEPSQWQVLRRFNNFLVLQADPEVLNTLKEVDEKWHSFLKKNLVGGKRNLWFKLRFVSGCVREL